MSDEPDEPRGASDENPGADSPANGQPTTDPWGNPLPPGTVQQPPRSAIPEPPPVPAPPPGPGPGSPPAGEQDPTAGSAPPEAWWPADPAAQPSAPPPTDPVGPAPSSPPTGGTDAWGRPIGGDPPPGAYPETQPGPGQPVQPVQPGQPGEWPPQGQPMGGYAPAPKTEGTAVGALVCGILGLVCGAIGVCGVLLGPAGIGLGIAARRKIARAGGRLTGGGLAMAGLVLGSIGTALSVIWIIVLIANPDLQNDLTDMINDLTTTTTEG